MGSAIIFTASPLKAWKIVSGWKFVIVFRSIQMRIADVYHAFKDMERSGKVALLVHIHANDGNLSIPLYMCGRSVGDEKAEYVPDGLKAAINAWKHAQKTWVQQLRN